LRADPLDIVVTNLTAQSLQPQPPRIGVPCSSHFSCRVSHPSYPEGLREQGGQDFMPLMHPELHPLLTIQAGLQNGAIDVRRVGIWLHSIQGQMTDAGS
jgi:hypothetical protein